MDAGLASLAGGLVGARLTFVIVHSGYYLSRPLESFSIWQGGLSWFGAVAGSVLGLMVYSRFAKTAPWIVADMLAVPAMLVGASAWVGCFLDGCAYGYPVQSAWWPVRSPDWTGNFALRWPTQLVGSLLYLLSIAGLLRIAKVRSRPGIAACLSLALLSAIYCVLSLTRGDPIWMVFGLRLDTLASFTILLPSLALLVWHMEKDRIRRRGCPVSP
jgi:phosphatidylglycerol:prolipoprotein diacylglycerol transferase